ncbi:uncharacterized protein LOC113279369 [Papaver somniferum]|uniref:uncharacterized protein LOC113279369 n=1 Tax=Papaver somniferum TaxID=3469 RepID=UPI000E6FCE46|nr:uncharacterized protein LOC113279369 [Papaver somniferum]
MSMLLVDFRNAFNLVDRSAMLRAVRNKFPSISRWVEFCYSSPARLYYGSSTLSSSQGVQQGDPLGPLIFSLTLHPIALKISQQCKLDLQAWYLDDGTIIGDTLMVSQDFHIIKTEGAAIGLDLNIQKTELFWPSFYVRSTQVGVFPADIVRPSVGVKLLGGPVSLDASFCSQLVLDRVHKYMQLMDAVHRLDDPQSELMLLHNCAGVSKLYFTLRSTAPCYVKDAQDIFDKYLTNFMRKLVTGDGPGYGLLQHKVASLPIRDGGLGIYSMYDTMQYCYLDSCSQTLQLQETILQGASIPVKGLAYQFFFDNFLQDMPSRFGMSRRDLTLWQCNKTIHAQDFLLAIPADGLGQKIGPHQFSDVLSYRLGIPLSAANSSCICCNRDMDVYGDHALHCASEVGIKFRHDLVRDTFADICYRASVPYKVEASLGFLFRDGGDARPADILVYNWEEGRDTCFDVTGVSPFVGGGVQSFTLGLALAKGIERKLVKYLEVCNANGYSFGTLAFTTFGELGIEIIDFLKRLKNYIDRHDANVKVAIHVASQPQTQFKLPVPLSHCLQHQQPQSTGAHLFHLNQTNTHKASTSGQQQNQLLTQQTVPSSQT